MQTLVRSLGDLCQNLSAQFRLFKQVWDFLKQEEEAIAHGNLVQLEEAVMAKDRCLQSLRTLELRRISQIKSLCALMAHPQVDSLSQLDVMLCQYLEKLQGHMGIAPLERQAFHEKINHFQNIARNFTEFFQEFSKRLEKNRKVLAKVSKNIACSVAFFQSSGLLNQGAGYTWDGKATKSNHIPSVTVRV